jgi:hypothetical protein
VNANKGNTTKRYRLDPKKLPQAAASDLQQLDRMKDAEIDYTDILELEDEFFKKATVAWPPVKRQLTIRLVLSWLKANGRPIRRELIGF